MPFYQNGQSKLKMVVLMPPNEQNIVWYSPVWQNHKHNETIINGMLQRFRKQEVAKRVAVYQFYENNVLVFQHKNK
jgi:hypothetical protein